MPFIETISTETGDLGIWKLGETSAELTGLFHFSDSERVEFNKIKNEKRRLEYLATRLLLQYLLNEKPEIEHLESGKPILRNSNKNISISHSNEFVVILLSSKKIGIDVENTEREITKIAAKFLHRKELDRITKTANKNLTTTIYWSAKEAIFKCTDLDGIQFDEQIIIHPFDVEDRGFFTATFIKNIRFKLWYRLYENNVIVYCVELEHGPALQKSGKEKIKF